MYDKVISIGETCQVAKQIRSQLKQTEAYYFDWLISPLPALINAVDSWFDGILQADNLAYPHARKIGLVDAVNGLQYQHGFPVDKDNPDPAQRGKILAGFEEHATSVREKYLRRATRMHDVLTSGNNVLLVRYVQALKDLSNENRKKLRAAFETTFPSASLTFLWASALIDEHHSVEGGWMCHLPRSDRWDGDAVGWTDVFRYCGALEAR